MPEFLLEVGCEELPASFVEKAYTDLAATLSKELEGLGLKNSEPVAMGTPRRLIVSFPDLKARQEDATKEQRGPSLQAAFGADGAPTGALLGFCKSQGISPEDLRKDEQYVWVTKHIPGRETAEVLAEILPKIILGLNFEKSMRWGSSKVRFARPIRWVLASLGGELVSFDVEDLPSGLTSRGHRFYAPQPFEAKTFNELITKLRASFVEPDVEMRRDSILVETKSVAEGEPEITEDLLDENAFLCEWPTAIRGTFPESFLELPEPVLVTAMAKHERMFPVRDKLGKLTNAFVFVRNSGEDETVRRGCEWVLGARFNDARFFFEQDQKLRPVDFLEKTKDILFQAQLGTMRQRADRLSSLCAEIASTAGASSDEMDLAELAGRFAKFDLSTGLVSELSSLQGVIGAEYLRMSRGNEVVATAIGRQYSVPSSPLQTVEDRISGYLIIADQLDKLAGYLGLGLEPTGSSDPYGLRKAVTTLIRVAENWVGELPSYVTLLNHAFEEYAGQGFDLDQEKASASLKSIFEGRYIALFDQYPNDVINAAMLSNDLRALMSPQSVVFRLNLISDLKQSGNFVQTASRPINIVSAAQKKGIQWANPKDIDGAKLDSVEGAMLLKRLEAPFEMANLKEHLLSLADPINAFFDNTMVLAEDEGLRFQRLGLANAAAKQLLLAGDFTKLEG